MEARTGWSYGQCRHERLEFPFQVEAADGDQVRLQAAVAGFWREIGVRVQIDNVTGLRLRDRQTRETYPGVSTAEAAPTVDGLSGLWRSSQVPRAETRYIGQNTAHWASPEADRLLDRIENSFNRRETEALVAQFSKLFSDELPALPLYYPVEVTAAHKSLVGARPRAVGAPGASANWNCHQWEWTGRQ